LARGIEAIVADGGVEVGHRLVALDTLIDSQIAFVDSEGQI